MKRTLVFAIAILILSILAIGLGGLVPKSTIQIIEGKDYLSSIQVVSATPSALLPINGTWATISEGMAIIANNFNGILPASTSPISATANQDLDVDIGQYPILYLQVNVSAGTSYGIRFSSFSTPLWSDNDVLNHRVGTGQVETIQLNMQAYTNQSELTITSVQFYVEEPASSAPTAYNVSIINFSFYSQSLSAYNPNDTGSYGAIYVQLSNLSNSLPLSRVNIGLTLNASDGTNYQSYLIYSSTIFSNYGYTFSPVITTFQYTLYPKNTNTIYKGFAYVRPQVNDSAFIIALTVDPGQGAFKSVSINYITLYCLPTPSYAPPAKDSLYILELYLIVFIFLLPIIAALILYQWFFKRMRLTKRNAIIFTLVVGSACRLCLAPFTLHPSDSEVYATAARAWYQYWTTSAVIGPTLPYTFFLQWIPYSIYALIQTAGFQDILWLGHQVGLVEDLFLKLMPIISDFVAFFILLKFVKNEKYVFLALLFFLNPFCIYVSSVWGQYEMLVAMFILLGIYLLSKGHQVRSSVAFAASIATGLFGAIPLGLNFIGNICRRASIKKILLMLAPLLIIALYLPELYYIYLDALGALGLSPVFSSESSNGVAYTVIGSIPGLGPLIMVIVTVSVIAVFVWRKDFTVQSITRFTIIETLAIILCSRTYPQFWVYLIPLTALYAIMTQKDSLGGYMFVFGAFVTGVTLAFTQSPDYMLLGRPGTTLFSLIERVGQGLTLYLALTTVLGILIVPYLFKKNGNILRTAIQTVVIAFGVLIVTYVVLTVVI